MIVDTAGRLAIDEAMMQEIRALHAALKPVETLFVVDAMQGQDAVNVSKAFADALPLTGCRADQARRRRARRRGAVGAAGDRQADQVRGRRREARQPRAVPSRAHGLAHPRHGRRAEPGGGGAPQRRPGGGREARQEGQERQRLRPRGLQVADAADEQDGRLERPDGQAAGATRRNLRRAPTWTRR